MSAPPDGGDDRARRSGGVRVLCVTETFPWPPASGYQLRLATILRGLTGSASVDLWVTELDEASSGSAAEHGLRRLHVARAARRPRLARLARWAAGSLPRAQLEVDAGPLRAALGTWAEDGYDVVWCGHLRTCLWVAGIVDAPIVLDLDNLGDAAIRHRRDAQRAWRPRRGLTSRIREMPARVADAIDVRRYARVQRQIAHEVDTVVVCSELDQGRLGVGNSIVIPNTYREPVPPAELHAATLDAPRILMIGRFDYPPNLDAARFFAGAVLPLVRRALPGARLRLVGRHRGALDDLRAVDGVEVLGEIGEVDGELRAADVSMVPLRFGGGTRLKILEAFAYRIPVVSTTMGCEGLDVIPGEHLLVADEPGALADACVRAVREPELRVSLTTAAHRLLDSRYRDEVAEAAVGELVRRVAGAAVAPSDPSRHR